MATKLLSVKECKGIYRLSRMPLINYEKKGLLKPLRTPDGVRRHRVNRRDLQQILKMTGKVQVEKVVIKYPDRLARFGFNYLREFFDSF